MIIVKYTASGMKSVVAEDVSPGEFWLFFRMKRKQVRSEDTDEVYVDNSYPEHAFEIVDERRADGCDRYVGRPDDWPITDGEPA